MNNGWILIHRKLSKKAWFSNPNYVALWVHLLFKAAWKDTQLMMNGSLVSLKRGQLLTGRKALSTTSGISQNIVRSILIQFENDQQITIQRTNKYSIITVLNYDEYQSTNQPTTSKPPTEHQQSTSQPPHIKEVKELKEVKEALPDGLNIEAWDGWLAFRKQMQFKKYKTLSTAKKLSEYSTGVQMLAVKYSIDNEYQGLFPERYTNGKDKRVSEFRTPVQKVEDAIAKLRASGEGVESGGADIRGQVVDKTQ